MTEYSDIEQIAALQAEQANIDMALTILDDFDGTVPTCTVAPTTAAPDSAAPTAVVVYMADPPQSMVAGIRSGLIQRNNAINKELRDLGVTGVPDDKPGGGPPA